MLEEADGVVKGQVPGTLRGGKPLGKCDLWCLHAIRALRGMLVPEVWGRKMPGGSPGTLLHFAS